MTCRSSSVWDLFDWKQATSRWKMALGLIPFKSPSYEEAITKLYQHAGVSEGKAQALVNVVHENNSTYFLLFALPKITVRADVIEFIDGTMPVKTQDAEIIR